MLTNGTRLREEVENGTCSSFLNSRDNREDEAAELRLACSQSHYSIVNSNGKKTHHTHSGDVINRLGSWPFSFP
jgi:hypothetical protein